MIISASYKTDIPAYYGKWFMERLKSGYCKTINNYSKKVNIVSLRKDDVDGFVFWTRNLGPFLENIEIIHKLGYPFVIQYAIVGYPKLIEYSIVDIENSIKHMKIISNKFGQKVGVWRYDTILFSSLTTIDFHRRNFLRIARELEGTTDQVIISFAQIYKKAITKLNSVSKKYGFSWINPEDEEKTKLVKEFALIANSFGMKLAICAQPEYLIPETAPSSCIDARRLSEIAGKLVKAEIRGNRPNCQCYLSKDIGEYDTCPRGCIYCYAVVNRNIALYRYRSHDPMSEFLFNPSFKYIDTKKQPTIFFSQKENNF